MDPITLNKMKFLEEYLGFDIVRDEVTIESNKPHDENLSYQLCQKFFEKDSELRIIAKRTEEILVLLIKKENIDAFIQKEISVFFSFLGDVYYLLKDFNKCRNCYLKALSYNKIEIGNWVGLMFAYRAMGEIDIFEEIIFNFEKISMNWRREQSKEMNINELSKLISDLK